MHYHCLLASQPAEHNATLINPPLIPHCYEAPGLVSLVTTERVSGASRRCDCRGQNERRRPTDWPGPVMDELNGLGHAGVHTATLHFSDGRRTRALTQAQHTAGLLSPTERVWPCVEVSVPLWDRPPNKVYKSAPTEFLHGESLPRRVFAR